MRRAREATGLSLRELARQMGISATFLSDVERDRAALPLTRYEQLPDAIRGPVIDAALAELQDQADKLEAMR